jgi:hypothetical protein
MILQISAKILLTLLVLSSEYHTYSKTTSSMPLCPSSNLYMQRLVMYGTYSTVTSKGSSS